MEKSVENVEKCEFSTTKPRLYTGGKRRGRKEFDGEKCGKIPGMSINYVADFFGNFQENF